ncbi:hypothetical protein K469DRAFT_301518 [Zopfia rhizophila CBS 207.26]|uniref:TPR-like protein n=1 Tax=Zopfia rhizophila CBS 207.26 TaxID=1314779 RepID=A0A6A6DM96_9PEZI|nr:hypothetical protein K469DRAFT_301518 [Zopfia rhizophila CBS 207.26]
MNVDRAVFVLRYIFHRNLGTEHTDQLFQYWILKLLFCEITKGPIARASAMAHVARGYQARRRFTEAESLLRLSLPERERPFGVHAPVVILHWVELAKVYEHAGKVEKCQDVLQAGVQSATITYGPDSNITCGILKKLCGSLEREGKLDEYNEILQRHICTLQEKHGVAHPKGLELLMQLGTINKRHSRITAAQEAYNQVFLIQKGHNGPDHVETLRTAMRLARTYGLGECHWHLYKAKALYKRAMAGLAMCLGSEDEETLEARFEAEHSLRETRSISGR